MASIPYPPHLNIEFTPELERDVAFFKRWGYFVVDDAIDPVQIEALCQPFDGPFAQRMRAEGSDEQKILMGAIEKW